MKTLKRTALVLFFLLFSTTAWADQEADIKAVRKVLEDYSEFNLAGDAKSWAIRRLISSPCDELR